MTKKCAACEPEICGPKREVVCACKPEPPQAMDCKVKPIEVSEITICEERIPPYESTKPHEFYPRLKECKCDKEPQAPIFMAADEGPEFTAFGITFTLKAGAIDTRCKAEIATLNMPSASGTISLIDYSSDLAITGLDGTFQVIVNGASYDVSSGDFIYIRAGSSFSIVNNSGDKASAELTTLGPGTLGFFKQIASYENAVGGPTYLDGNIVSSIGKKYCIVPAYLIATSGETVTPIPGTIQLIPNSSFGDCCSGSWGLTCCEFLVLSVIDANEAVLRSITIKPQDCHNTLILSPDISGDTVSVTARIIRNPECGVPEVIREITINGSGVTTLNSGAVYSVLYDGCIGDVCVMFA